MAIKSISTADKAKLKPGEVFVDANGDKWTLNADGTVAYGESPAYQQAQKDKKEKELLGQQQRLADLYKTQASDAEEQRLKTLTAMSAQTQKSDMEARRIAAEAMAQTAGGIRGGGSGYGQMLQTARQAGDDSRQYMDQRVKEQEMYAAQSLEDVAQQRAAAMGQQIEATQSALDYGTQAERDQAAWQAAQAEIQSIIDKYADTYIGEQELAARDLYALAHRQSSNYVAQQIYNLADQVASGEFDV